MLKRSGNFVFEVKIALALGTIFLSTAANTAYAAERNLRVSYSAPATAFLPLWAAKDAGIFERNNLTVELLYVGSSPIALSALLSDELAVLAGGGTAAPTAYLQGFRDLALFSTLDHRFAFKIFTVPSIVDVAGFPAVTEGKPILTNARVKLAGQGAQPVALRIAGPNVLTPDNDAALVRMEGHLLSVLTNPLRSPFQRMF